MSKDASSPLTEYAIVARKEMKIDENLTVFPISVSLERREISEFVRSSALFRGHCASKAEAATTSTPTYAKVANDRDMLGKVSGLEGTNDLVSLTVRQCPSFWQHCCQKL
jgi:hypothetical protein